MEPPKHDVDKNSAGAARDEPKQVSKQATRNTRWISSMPTGILIGTIATLLATSMSATVFPSLEDADSLPLENLPSSWAFKSLLGRPAVQSSTASPSGSSQELEEQEQEQQTPAFVCAPHAYTSQIISTSPLVIHIPSFLSPEELAYILALEAEFNPSNVNRGRGRNEAYQSRTSTSAALARGDPGVECILDRARRFMGPSLFDGARDEMGTPQMVRYVEGQKFDLHRDWFPTPQPASAKNRQRGRGWNRKVSFFVVLENEGVVGGETWFPELKAKEDGTEEEKEKEKEKEEEDPETAKAENGKRKPKEIRRPWRRHPKGGVAFSPTPGNAVFWVNLHSNGTGDERTEHSGLPVQGGRKTAMNIWPRQYID